MQYNIKYTDTGESDKTIVRGTSGTLGTLSFTIVDENDDAVNFTGMTTVKELYVGIEGALITNGVTLTSETAASGLATYTIPWATFGDDDDCGVFNVEIYLADNVSPTKAISAGGATLTVIPSIIDGAV